MVLRVKVDLAAWGQSCWLSAWTVEGPAWDCSWPCPEAAPSPAVRSLKGPWDGETQRSQRGRQTQKVSRGGAMGTVRAGQDETHKTARLGLVRNDWGLPVLALCGGGWVCPQPALPEAFAAS